MPLLRLIGFVVGASVCISALLSWQVEPSARMLGADVRVIPTPPGELAVTPGDVLLAAHGLRPGADPVRSTFEVRNQTGASLRIRVRGLPSSRSLDRSLRLSFRSRGREVAAGSAGELRQFSGPGLRLARGDSAEVTMSVWLAANSRGWSGQVVDVAAEFEPRPLGARP